VKLAPERAAQHVTRDRGDARSSRKIAEARHEQGEPWATRAAARDEHEREGALGSLLTRHGRRRVWGEGSSSAHSSGSPVRPARASVRDSEFAFRIRAWLGVSDAARSRPQQPPRRHPQDRTPPRRRSGAPCASANTAERDGRALGRRLDDPPASLLGARQRARDVPRADEEPHGLLATLQGRSPSAVGLIAGFEQDDAAGRAISTKRSAACRKRWVNAACGRRRFRSDVHLHGRPHDRRGARGDPRCAHRSAGDRALVARRFELDDLDCERLHPGTTARVSGRARRVPVDRRRGATRRPASA